MPKRSSTAAALTALATGLITCDRAVAQGAVGQAPVKSVVTAPTVVPAVPITPVTPVAALPALHGFVDMHAHLMSNIAFGGKLVYGGVDVGSIVPIDRGGCYYINAASESDALNQENMAHGGWGLDNGCGDVVREAFIHTFQRALGANDPTDDTYKISGPPNFATWPGWNDLTRQRMWIDWIRHSYGGGLRVMVALATNSKLFGDIVSGAGDLVHDDRTSADQQIAEIRNLVARHADFMAIALTSTDLYNIVSANRLAVVLGVEIDQIGNFAGPNVPAAALTAEVDRLYAEGVRYIFPLHITDNALGGTSLTEDVFALANQYENGNWPRYGCAADIDYKWGGTPRGFGAWLSAGVGAAALTTRLGIAATAAWAGMPGMVPCASGQGNVNQAGLTAGGQAAIRQMMRRGMLIDIDHMSQNSVAMTLAIANSVPGGYPLNSGHNHVRGTIPGEIRSERNFTQAVYAAIGNLHGMAGVGSARLDAVQWLAQYANVVNAMGGPSRVAAGFGTDMNGLEFAMPPRVGAVWGWYNPVLDSCVSGCRNTATCPAIGPLRIPCETACQSNCSQKFASLSKWTCTQNCSLPPAPAVASWSDGVHTWDYNSQGVAHYGMLPDFLQDVSSLPGGVGVVQNVMMGADYFFHTWQISESRRSLVP